MLKRHKWYLGKIPFCPNNILQPWDTHCTINHWQGLLGHSSQPQKRNVSEIFLSLQEEYWCDLSSCQWKAYFCLFPLDFQTSILLKHDLNNEQNLSKGMTFIHLISNVPSKNGKELWEKQHFFKITCSMTFTGCWESILHRKLKKHEVFLFFWEEMKRRHGVVQTAWLSGYQVEQPRH